MNIKIAATGAAATAMVVTGLLASPANAGTHTVNWTQRAYGAFTTWEAHPTRANLDTLVVDSFHLPAKYDASDIAHLYGDVLGNAKATYISDDEQYIYQDLTGSGL